MNKEIEDFLDHVCHGLRASASSRSRIRDELREHLLAAEESHIREGLSTEDAAKLAIKEFGDPKLVGHELSAIYRQNLFSYLLERAMVWRETDMRKGWKWRFVALVTLVVMFALQLLAIFFCVNYVYPRVVHSVVLTDYPHVPRFESLWGLYSALSHHGYLPLCVLAACWLLFEWKYSGENKSNVRLASMAIVCLGTALLSTLVVFGALIQAAALAPEATLAPPYRSVSDSAPLVSLKLDEADIVFSQLSDACAEEDWDAVGAAARDLTIIFEGLQRSSGAAVILGKPRSAEDRREMQGLIEEVAHESRSVRRLARGKKLSLLPIRYAELAESYTKFRKGVEAAGHADVDPN